MIGQLAVGGMTLVLTSLAALADDATRIQGHCRAIVEGATWIDGACKIRREADGSFGFDAFRVELVGRSGQATATWSHFDAAADNDVTRRLGPLKRRGACWSNRQAKICAWDDEAEIRRNRASSYRSFHALVGRDLEPRCHMGNCEWFRYDRVRRVAHTAHEALLLIDERTWNADDPRFSKSRQRRRLQLDDDYFYVVCSRSRPAQLAGDGADGWTLMPVAPATGAGSFGVNEYFYARYAAACHGRLHLSDDLAIRLGYAPDADSQAPYRRIATPRDALK